MSILSRKSFSDQVMNKKLRAGGRRAARFLPWLLVLDERTLLSNILTVTNTNDNGNGSLRADVAAAQAGDSIVFSPKIYGQTITLTSGPIADTGTSLQIQGPGAALLTVSGNNQSGIFNLQPTDPSQSPFAVSISGLTLSDAAGPDSSPSYAINDTNASLTLSGDVIADNRSGGVLVLNAYEVFPPVFTVAVNITNSAFLDNTSDQAGGALSVAGVNLAISNSSFEGNATTATQSNGFNLGGALYLTNTFFVSTNTTSTIDNCLFIGNSAQDDGGAIENWGGPLTINSCTFVGNQSSMGGAIENEWATVTFGAPLPTGAFTLTNSTFLDNQAIGVTNGFFGSANGGAINFFNINGPMSINSSTFVSNVAEGNDGGTGLGGEGAGGAIDAFFPSSEVTGPISFAIAHSTFIDNQAISGNGDTGGGMSQGGAVRLGGILNATVTDSQFIGNLAVGGSGGSGDNFPYFNTTDQSAFGGAIEVESFEASITGSAFINNAAMGGNGGPGQIAGVGEGGAIDNQFSPLVLSSDTFVGNLAKGGDGGPAAAGSSADGGAGGQAVGGAFANYDFLPFGTTLSLSGLTFVGNQAIGGGWWRAGDGAGSGGVGGDALGGGILNAGGLAVSSSQFTLGLAKGGDGGAGGATGAGGGGGNAYGGAIVSASFGDPTVSSLSVSTSTFIGNLAIGADGGPGSPDGSDGQGNGGAIAIIDGLATITKSKFAGNRASTSGNDIYGTYTS